MGPSIAEGSQGCSPNWADFPVAAKMRPIRGSVRSISLDMMNICCISQLFRFIAIHAILKMSPMSPTRLYMTACSAAVFASARPYHQPISKKDIIPTPSHPMKS